MKISSGQAGFAEQGGNRPELVEGEKIGGSVVRRMNNGMYLINLKGHQLTAKLDAELGDSVRFRAQVVKSGQQIELKIIKNFEDGFNSAVVKNASGEGVKTEGSDNAVIFRLLKGTIPGVKEGDTVNLNIIRTLSNGLKLLDANGYMFKADLGDTVMNMFKAEVIKTQPFLELIIMKSVLENLNPVTVKTELGKFDFTSLLKSVGKFTNINLQNVTPDDVKNAVKESGLFFESKLLKGEQVTGDEKFRAYAEQDTSAREAITRLQLVNILAGDGLVSYLKIQNQDVSDALVRYKKDGKDGGTIYISLEFSNIGKTLLIIRQVREVFDILVKSEADISDMIKNVEIENAFVRWMQYDSKDESIFEIKKDTAEHLGGFDTTV